MFKKKQEKKEENPLAAPERIPVYRSKFEVEDAIRVIKDSFILGQITVSSGLDKVFNTELAIMSSYAHDLNPHSITSMFSYHGRQDYSVPLFLSTENFKTKEDIEESIKQQKLKELEALKNEQQKQVEKIEKLARELGQK